MKTQRDLAKIMNVLLDIKKINEEIRIDIEQRMFDLTALIRMKEVRH